MGRSNVGLLRQVTIGVLLLGTTCSGRAFAQTARESFTVADEIGLSHFGDPYGLQAEAVETSPDGKYIAVFTERGRVDTNRPEGSLRFYRTEDVKNFLKRSDVSPPEPIWVIVVSEYKDGPTITNWRWLLDSDGLVFLERTVEGKQRLMLADLQKKEVRPLTTSTESVELFDIRNANYYVYTVAEQPVHGRLTKQLEAPAVVATGQSFNNLFFPDDPRIANNPVQRPRRYVWAVQSGRRFLVKHDGEPLVVDYLGGELMALSPDGRSLVTAIPVLDVPKSWETLYPPSSASSPHRIRAGHYEVQLFGSAHQYAKITLETGSVQLLTEAPIGFDVGGWSERKRASWSGDGQAVLLTNTFLKSKTNSPSRPCIAVVDLVSNTRTCLEAMKGRTEKGVVEEGYHLISAVNFVEGDKERVLVTFINYSDRSAGHTEYRQDPNGTWRVDDESNGESDTDGYDLKIDVKQGINDQPVLVATNTGTSRVLWDPNPQLKNMALGVASIYTWRDNQGRNWKGGLYKPPNYKVGQRYPLVIQTHGFTESEFAPSGAFPTAFAARALASAGLLVLQVGESCPLLTTEEGPCAVSGYQSAANQLVSEGLVDPEKIGMIGFSRTCFYVMETLTSGSLRIKAASITDGVMEDYFQYLLGAGKAFSEADSMIGSRPFGEGLQDWLKRSPGFNLDKISAPLLVVGEGISSLLSMWQPYAGLYYLHKPVDLVMLNTDEHVLTNPAVRMASQGGTVDWFRFWLLGEEDSDPQKADQYARWRDLRKLQEENEQKAKGAAVN